MTENSNYPNLPITFRILRYPSIGALIGFIGFSCGMSLGGSLALAFGSVFLIVFSIVGERAIALCNHVNKFGAKTQLPEGNDTIFGAVPIRGKGAILHVVPSLKGVTVHRLFATRYIDWSEVLYVRRVNFLGHQILKLGTTKQSEHGDLYVPWSNEANHFLPERLRS